VTREENIVWKRTTFEREVLYSEVWSNPVAKVADRYGISDVGLRKICKKLGVPLPTMGYWAKKRAGKPVSVTSLPSWSGETTFTSVRFVSEQNTDGHKEKAEEPEEVLNQRTFEALPKNEIAVRTDLSSCHHWVTATRKLVKTPGYSPYGLVVPQGGTSLSISVSAGQVQRALLIWDAVLRAAEKRGFKVETKRRQDHPLADPDIVLEVLGETMYLSVDERVRRIERDLTKEEVKAKRNQPNHWISNRYVYEPTGVLKLTLRQEARGTAIVQFADKTHRPVEQQLHELMVALVATAVARKHKRAAAEERKKQAAIEEAARSKLRQQRERSLKVLHAIEALALRWERAQRLRAFAAALEESVAVTPPTDPEHRANQLAWIRKRAGWLDPLVRSPWPEVDVQDYSYHHEDWMTRYAEYEGVGVDDILVTAASLNDKDSDD
jgi:hypothetical protein